MMNVLEGLTGILKTQLDFFKWVRFMLFVIFIFLAVHAYNADKQIDILIDQNNQLISKVAKLESTLDDMDIKEEVYIFNIEKPKENIEEIQQQLFTVTAYDNSIESQGPYVGQTATGYRLDGHTRESAKCIAVDPRVIPLGSTVEVIFEQPYENFSGEYIARDTGGAIKGNKIDLFMGDGVDKTEVQSFGVRKALVRVLDKE